MGDYWEVGFGIHSGNRGYEDILIELPSQVVVDDDSNDRVTFLADIQLHTRWDLSRRARKYED